MPIRNETESLAAILRRGLTKQERHRMLRRLEDGYEPMCGPIAYRFYTPPLVYGLEALAEKHLAPPEWDESLDDYAVPDEWRARFMRLCLASMNLVPRRDPNYIGPMWGYSDLLAKLTPQRVRVAVEISA